MGSVSLKVGLSAMRADVGMLRMGMGAGALASKRIFARFASGGRFDRRGFVSPPKRALFTSLNPFASGEVEEMEPKKHLERRLVNFSPEQVYEVVKNVDEYKDFVPWCTDSRIISSNGSCFQAKLGVGFNLLSEQYTSLVTVEPQKSVRAEVQNNPLFQFLVNEWLFKQGPREGTTWLEFLIAFQFKNQMYQGLSSIFFDQVASKMVQAFEQRCMEKYGRMKQAL
uniref:Coenzyme Q-binding protein COQ10 START domain-containing protein n=1 Tax=Rhodosorus marinus TaxID=101924 RepID=A0A7S3A3G5_9RHOD|mmetsp:Transcript_42064/g.164715  ORF Transcript_42064/g.164715 Transcript_42064/m.164715 type:complete len:225 (+) Transcript_42064:208-882(+)|eukprot:CAMPEP_0113961156 /NCGR_PEP_ID=MMETSP0011_2-20120614/5138_1 /TAXON_ID=101924 /ORGANISM="Rhodosorus marinus" /LENGTH=224 /DNA_ID=CAMNT_0000972737 /DNA_START=191 /DNA_END=865 /DNA_ORIENTATION=+ /assembly_acc=CAM_ASM_000156